MHTTVPGTGGCGETLMLWAQYRSTSQKVCVWPQFCWYSGMRESRLIPPEIRDREPSRYSTLVRYSPIFVLEIREWKIFCPEIRDTMIYLPRIREAFYFLWNFNNTQIFGWNPGLVSLPAPPQIDYWFLCSQMVYRHINIQQFNNQSLLSLKSKVSVNWSKRPLHRNRNKYATK